MWPSRLLILVFALGVTPSLVAQDVATTQTSHEIEVSGVLLFNAYYNDDLVVNRAVPWLAAPRNPISGDRLEALGSTIRQSRIVVSAYANDVRGARMEGELDVDFFGNRNDGSRGEPIPRVRRIVGRVIWPNAWLLFGQDALPISSLDPSSFSTVSVPGFTGAGNLSRWMPQIRMGVEMGSSLRIGVEAAAIAPRFNTMMEEDPPNPDPAELSKRPFVQGRLLTRWGESDTGGEVSVGGHYGWFTAGVDSLGITKAAAVTARFFLIPKVEFRGEAFLGEALGMLGGGGIDQVLGPDGAPVRTKGGWAQLNVFPLPGIEVGGGYGLDDPTHGDIDPVTGLTYNVTWEIHGHLHVAPLVVALEYRRLETIYADALYELQTANHVNFALGFQF